MADQSLRESKLKRFHCYHYVIVKDKGKYICSLCRRPCTVIVRKRPKGR